MDNVKKIIISLSVISALSIILIAGGVVIVRLNSSHVESLISETYPSTMTLIDLKFHIINIQYWLTNISATRAMKGYDEGFGKALYHYRKARTLLKILMEQNRDNPGQYEKIKQIDDGLETYYEAAVATAAAYIESGTGYGNEMLKVISIQTASITSSLDALVDQQRAALDHSVYQLSRRAMLFQFFFLSGALIIMGLTVLVIFSRSIIGAIRDQSLALKTAHEELQSTYEELVATNEEYEAQNEELLASQTELEEKERRFRTMLEHLPLPVIMIEGNRVLFINRTYEEKFGYSIDDFKTAGDMLEKLYPDEKYRNSLVSLYEGPLMNLAENAHFDIPLHSMHTREGECLEIETKVSRFSGIIIATMYDMTDLRKAQKMLIQSEKLTTIGTLAAGMAHEINNPLGIIMQGIQTMQNRFSIGNEKTCHLAEELGLDLQILNTFMTERNITKYMEGISEAGERASRIIANMLQFSRKGSGDKALADINKILERSLDMVSSDFNINRKYDFRKIEIVRNMQADLPYIACHETEMEQVFINLLKNAAQAMEFAENAERKPCIEIHTGKAEGSIRIRITDNGNGMDEYVKDHIFEPFYSTKQVGSGTGLGLFVSYFIVTNNHNGSILVDSEPGRGTTFTISLPVNGVAENGAAVIV